VSKTNSPTTTAQVLHIAKLANLTVSDSEAQELATGFDETLGYIKNLAEIDTSKVEPAHHVTGLENITREDEIDEARMLSQDQALANAAKTHQGYFVVPQVIDQD